MGYRYYICDVFTETRFGGNQLAVLPEAHGLSDKQMQQIAREFNFSESAFVLPPGAGKYAPSPNIHTYGRGAVRRASERRYRVHLGDIRGVRPGDRAITVTFEEEAGQRPDDDRRRDGMLWCELSAPGRCRSARASLLKSVASAVSLAVNDVVTTTHDAPGGHGWLTFSHGGTQGSVGAGTGADPRAGF